MNLNIHHLKGCSPTPLAHYLKAIGILRLIAEQIDPTARGWWQDESFYLLSTLNEAELCDFFLNVYEPTPLIAPWNGGSGFYPKDNKQGITEIRESKSPRLATYRDAIKLGDQQTAGRSESPKKEDKFAMLQSCRQNWRGPLFDWLEAAVVINADGEPVYPALLGTGGNDGRLDFTNNFMQRLTELFNCLEPDAPAKPATHTQLKSALFGLSVSGLPNSKVGQFLPGNVGGDNSGTGFSGKGLVNPWDFVLMLEGTIAFASSVSRRANNYALPQAAAPFAVYSSATGFGSAAESEKSRGEQWMPLWRHPTAYHEIHKLIADGRSQVGSKPARQPVDFGRAIARLGVARGITAFERYGYIERNGQANLATPLGRWDVHARPHQNLIDQIAPWVDKLQRASTDKTAPASIGRAARVCYEAIMACCRGQGTDTTLRWQALLVALGDAEAGLLRSPRFTTSKRLQPLPQLEYAWLKAIGDSSAEYRLAVAFASQFFTANKNNSSDHIRRHFLPLNETQKQFNCNEDRLIVSPEVVCINNDLQSVSIALIRRRIIEAGQKNIKTFPLQAVHGAYATLHDLSQLLAGQLDENKILQLIRPLLALKWPKGIHLPRQDSNPNQQADGIMNAYGLLRLTHWHDDLTLTNTTQPHTKQTNSEQTSTRPYKIRLDPTIFSRLATGDMHGAMDAAIRRLRIVGLRPHITQTVGNPRIAAQLAMALAFPISLSNAQILAKRLTKPNFKNDNNNDKNDDNVDVNTISNSPSMETSSQ